MILSEFSVNDLDTWQEKEKNPQSFGPIPKVFSPLRHVFEHLYNTEMLSCFYLERHRFLF